MSNLSMTDDEIRTKHRKGTAIGILAELNACSVETIKQIVGVKPKEVKPAAEPVIVLIPEKIPTKVREAKQLELYNQSKSDPEIANAVGVSPQLIFVWRKKNGLPNQGKRKGVVVPPVVPKPEKNSAKKAPAKARPVDKVLPMLNKVPKPVIKTPKTVINTPDTVVDAPKESPVQYTHFEPVTQEDREMFFADISEDDTVELQKPPMTLLGKEDVTRIMQEAKAAKVQDSVDPFSNLRKVKETCWPPKIVIAQTRIQDEKCDVCKNYGDFCTTCRYHDGFEPKFSYPNFSDGLIKPTIIMPTITIEEVAAQPKALMHILKCQQPYFDDIWEGYKSFEVRLNDREYEAGDSVLLIAYNVEHSIYETRQIFANIGYLLHGGDLPGLLDKETVVFSLINIKRYELQEVTVHDQK